MTNAVRFLREHGVAFEGHLYAYTGEGPVANEAARAIGVPEDAVYKTLVFESPRGPILVLMDAAHRVAPGKISRLAGWTEKIHECAVRDAERHTGYQVGGISPFGTRKPLPVFLDARASDHQRIYVNGGKRGFLVSLAVADLVRLLAPVIGDFGAD